MNKSTTASSSGKPDKPYDGFPLYAHKTGRWAKKIRGKLHYFGRWKGMPDNGWREALKLYQQERDDLFAGRTTDRERTDLKVAELCNQFLTFKKEQVHTEELSHRSFTDLHATAARLVRVFGGPRYVADLGPDDFRGLRADITSTRGPHATKSEINRVKAFFNFAFRNDLIEKPARYGSAFDPPSQKTLRKAVNANGPRMFEPEELRAILDACTNPTLKAMILLACNSGMGNHDLGMIPREAVDLEGGWVDFPREKTGIPRRFPLWPETVQAIRESLAQRPKPRAGHEHYLFLTRKRERWAKDNTAGTLTREFRKLMRKAGMVRKASFYDIRRTFQTVGEEEGETATRFIMGHVDTSMSARYRQRISDERLRKVTNHVRRWLWGEQNTPKTS